jgi:hypothetical protein
MTKVVNRKNEPYDVYIGRGTPFGNPYKIGRDGTRDDVIEKYREHFNKKLKDKSFRDRVKSLKGKVLGCWCKPDACHGDVIIEYLENERANTQTSSVQRRPTVDISTYFSD